MAYNETKNIHAIVEEICALAPELSSKKDEVRSLVEMLLESRPDAVIDAAFVEELRGRLHASIRTQKAASGELSETLVNRLMRTFNIKVAYGLMALVFMVLISLPFLDLSTGRYESGLTLAPEFEDAGKEAFGVLASATPTEGGVREEADMVAKTGSYDTVGTPQRSTFAQNDSVVSTALSDGVTTVSAPAMGMALGMGGGGDASVSASPLDPEAKMMVMPPWEYTYPSYIYTGELPAIDAEGYVYRRTTGLSASGIDRLVRSLDVGLVDLSSFTNTSVQRIELVSKDDPAYSVSVDFISGEVSIYRSWTDGPLREDMGTAYSSINNDEMISIANAFMEKHGIDVSSYGAPEVENQQMLYALAEDAAVSREMTYPIYSVSVRYPLLIDGMRVVESSGYADGIHVSINTQGKFVESVWGLTSQKYQRSSYSLLQDTDKILAMVKNGGYDGTYYAYDQNGRSVEVNVGEPQFALMKYWKYEEGKSQPTILLLPALMFPVDQEAAQRANMYGREAIVIPLVEKFLNEANPYPVPMPLTREIDATQAGTAVIEPAIVRGQ